jgi:dihydropteroate synthase
VKYEAEGADIIDVGGESTRPGSEPVPVDVEVTRVVPVINALRKMISLPISIDTYHAKVAEVALEAGADWVNDVWGLQMDAAMTDVVSRYACPVVIMHNRSKPKNVAQQERLGGRYVGMEYGDLIEDILFDIREIVNIALDQGIRKEQIIVDPGIGFGKTVSQNRMLINELDRFKELGYPILVGTSRKSFIGYTLGLPPEERLEGTLASTVIAVDRGADIVRVHDVKEIVRATRMTDSIIR